MKYVSEWIMWLFVGALVVLIVKNAQGFATATTAVGGQVRGAAGLLTGSNYQGGSVPTSGFLAQVQKAA